MSDDPHTPAYTPLVAGWREKAAFPQWHIRRMTVKLDTGAATGSVDCVEIDDLGDGLVRFVILLHRRSGDVSKHITAPVSRRTRVRSASGHGQDRLFVETDLVLGGLRRRVELSLSRRPKMLHRVLLGRRALAGVFLVDSSRDFLLPKPPLRPRARPSKDPEETP